MGSCRIKDNPMDPVRAQGGKEVPDWPRAVPGEGLLHSIFFSVISKYRGWFIFSEPVLYVISVPLTEVM